MKHIIWIDWHMQSPETENNTEYNVNSQINVLLDYVTFNVEQFAIVACFCLHDMNVCVQADVVV